MQLKYHQSDQTHADKCMISHDMAQVILLSPWTSSPQT